MKLLDEIISTAVDGKQSISDLLRKCLVFAYELENDKLKKWVEEELNGYDREEDIPDYRSITVVSKGTFHSAFGGAIRNRPIPSLALKEQHRRLVETAKLAQPIAAYDRTPTERIGDAMINWPTNLVAVYQAKIIEGYALVAAWQEIPASVFVALVDTVRNRVLRFALEIKKELGHVSGDVTAIKSEKVDQMITNYIFGGMNIIAGVTTDITQIGNILVTKGDFSNLAVAIKSLGLSDNVISALEKAIADDAAKAPASLGTKTAKWIKDNASKITGPAAKAGVEVVKAVLTKWIMQFLGLG
jgi:hypothetical protein